MLCFRIVGLRDSICDEGLFIRLLFRLSSSMLPGSFLIIVSILGEFTAEDFGYQHRRVGTLTIRLHSAERCFVHLFQCAPPPYVPRPAVKMHTSAVVVADIDIDDSSTLATVESDYNFSTASPPKSSNKLQTFSPLVRKSAKDSKSSPTTKSIRFTVNAADSSKK
jgi:hypothetical protein